MLGRGILFAAIAVAISGCASPLVKPNPLVLQSKASNAVDWQNMARRTVAAIPASTSGPAMSVYVDPGADAPFFSIYRKYLEEELYNHNFPVLRTPEGARIVLVTNTDWVVHDNSGKRITDYATLWASAAAFGGQFRHRTSIDTGYAAGIGTGIIFDFLASLNRATPAEVVVTSTIISPQSNNLHFVRSETVYVPPSELTYYMPPPDGLPVVSLAVGEQ